MTALNADKWLHQTLSGDTTLMGLISGVYAEHAPADASYPFAVISLVDGGMVANAYADRIMDNETWQVALINQSASYAGLEGAVDRVRALLHKQKGTGVLACVYSGSRRITEMVSGKVYRQIVLEFQVFTQ